ncbi:MAG: SDR family oxidoreductase [Wenzhouxiangellaceae bacterium]
MSDGRRLLIAGCGSLGNQLGAGLVAEGWQVYGLRRNVAALDPLIQPVAADLAASSLPQLPPVDHIIYTATPSGRDADAYRQAYLQGRENLLAALPPESTARLIYVSSTGVYDCDDGRWVDEDSVPEPHTDTSKILLQAEQLALRHGALVLRFAGIYGEQRRWLLRRAAEDDLQCVIDPPQWTNRIHQYDCVSALRHLLLQPDSCGIYHAVDELPAPRYEVYAWLRQQLGLPPPTALTRTDGAGQGKRVRCERLRSSGWRPRYPSYRDGYAALLEDDDEA